MNLDQLRRTFTEMFQSQINPDVEITSIDGRSKGEFQFSLHKCHSKLAVGLYIHDRSTERSEDLYCELWLFGYGEPEWKQYQKLVANEDYERLDVSYMIWGKYSEEKCILEDKDQNKNQWIDDDFWSVALYAAKSELCAWIARVKQDIAREKEEKAATELVARIPAPEDRYQPVPAPTIDGVLAIIVGGYPMGPTTYTLRDRPLVVQAEGSGLIEGLGMYDLRIPLSKAQAEGIGIDAANFISALADVAGITSVFLVPNGGITVNPVQGKKMDHRMIGKVLAESLGYSQFSLVDSKSGKEL